MLGTDTADHVRWMRLRRPEKLNAFTVEGYRALRVALEDASADPAVRVVVLTGEGRAFSVGADRSLLDGSSAGPTHGPPLDAGEEFERLLAGLAAFPKPLLAAVNGLAVGFGCTVLLHCDLVLAARSARLRLPFTAMGIVPEAASSVLLPARARWGDAMWAMLSSEWLEADRAQEMGLLWRVVPDDDLVTESAAAAAVLAELDPAAVVATKQLLTAGRTELVRTAHARELAAMSGLFGRARHGSDPTAARRGGGS